MQFLDLTGVKKFKEYTDNKFVTTEDVSVVDPISGNGYTKQDIDEMLVNLLTAMEEPMNGTWTIIDDNSGRRFIFTPNE